MRTARASVAATALSAALASACVKIEPACDGLSISPSAWSARVGNSRVFRASAPGLVDPRLTWELPAAAGALHDDALAAQDIRVVLGASSGAFRLVARVPGTDRRCVCAISAADFSFSFTRPIRIPGNGDTIVVGDVAIGTPAPASLDEGPGSGRVYVASLTDDAGTQVARVQQYTLDEFFSESPTPLYDTLGTGFVPGFDATVNAPVIVADAAGNGYWVDDRNGVGVLGILPANVTEGTRPSQFNLGSIPGLGLASNTGLAVDPQGGVYFTGFAPSATGYSYRAGTRLLRLSGLSSGRVALDNLASVLAGPRARLAIDGEGRVLVLTEPFSEGASPRLQRFLANGELDEALAPDPSVLAGARDIGVDSGNAIYLVATNTAGANEIRILDDVGALIRTQTSSGGGATFENVVGFGVAPDGTLVVVDDVDSATAAADVIVIEP